MYKKQRATSFRSLPCCSLLYQYCTSAQTLCGDNYFLHTHIVKNIPSGTVPPETSRENPLRVVHVRTTQAQRDALKLVKARLAEQGHYIFPVTKSYRQHYLDFIATPKDFPQKFVLVRPRKNGSIEVRPYCAPVLYTNTRKLLLDLMRRSSVPIRWNNKQLPAGKHRPDWWHDFIPWTIIRKEFPGLYNQSVRTKRDGGEH